MDTSLARDYKNPSQIAKILTENWMAKEAYCPSCLKSLIQAKANSMVLDFFCGECKCDFELKSKRGKFGKKINDGAYKAMIERLANPASPNFFFMSYSPEFKVQNLIAVPAYFIQPASIEKRKPLSLQARRAGWIGCNILSEKIPSAGKIILIENSTVVDKEKVKQKWMQTVFLQTNLSLDSRAWIIDILNCIEKLKSTDFSLKQLYSFEEDLAKKHPKNKHVKEKIRQQMQILRDKGVVDFVRPGFYTMA